MRRTIFLAPVTLVLLLTTIHGQQTPPAPQPWTLTEDAIRAILGRARAGRDLTPKTWPTIARIASSVSVQGWGAGGVC